MRDTKSASCYPGD